MRNLTLFALAGLIGCKPPVPTPEPLTTQRFVQTDTLEAVEAMATGTGGHLWIALDNAFALRESSDDAFQFVSRGDLPPGRVTFLGTIDGSREWLFAHVHGQGFFRNWANSGTWSEVNGLQSPLLEVLRPGLKPIPTGMTTTEDGITWLATVGGLYYTSDEGVSWDRADTSSSNDVNLVFTDVATHGDRVVAVSMLPEGLIPEQFAGVLGGRVFLSDNSGLTWQTPDEAFPSNHPTSVAVADDGTVYVGTMDEGIVRGDGNGNWTPLFGPSDVIDVQWINGGLTVASATRGLWRLDDDLWTQAGRTGAAGVTGSIGVLRDGTVYTLEDGVGDSPWDPAEGTVHIALSFFGNFHHSDRGDQPTEAGFGQDIRVMTSIVDWLDAHPTVKADWVFESARTTLDVMPTHSPELLERIQGRVTSGRDEIRLTGFAAESFASLPADEIQRSLTRAREANDALFGSYVNGLHPTHSMLSPDNIGTLDDQNIEWVSLYYGANGHTGPRNRIRLSPLAEHNPFELRDPQSNRTLTALPVYHHGDLLDHGGLEGWVKQLHGQHDEDTLLAIHFDADAESWENFDRELTDILDLPYVRFTTLGDYAVTHESLETHVLEGDIADGLGDGFSSWSEKRENQELWATLERSRRLSAAAELVAPADGAVTVAARDAMDARLEALATNNFGLSTAMHPDRVASAAAKAEQALFLGDQALELAHDTAPLDPQQLEVVNTSPTGGPIYVPFRLRMPAGQWEGEDGLVIERGDNPQAIRAEYIDTLGGSDVIRVEATVVLAPESRTVLDWSYDPGDDTHPRGTLTAADVPSLPSMQAPFVECTTGKLVATGGPIATTIGPWGLRNTRIEEWELPTCQGQSSTLRRTITKREGMSGVEVEVTGTIDQAADAGGILSLVLAPIDCPAGIESVSWRSYTGSIRSVTVPELVEAWNPASANGWIAATCGDGSEVQIAVDQTLSSSMGMLSLRNDANLGLLAPLGTLWGDPPWHDGPRSGGTGMADLVTPLIGGQFQPSAPAWAGKDVHLRLWVTTNTDPEILDLYARPPIVRSPLD